MKYAPVNYDVRAECPTFAKFLGRILAGDPDLIDFIQRALGYSLTGDTSEQCMFLPYGSGANGKSTLLEIVLTLLGDYGAVTPSETLLVRPGNDSAKYDLARLKGARFVKASETEDGKRLAEAFVKLVTGGDTISARHPYGTYFQYRPAFKLWLAVNHRPVIKGTDHGIWRRIFLVPFDVTIPETERDKELPEKLAEELPGNSALGCRRVPGMADGWTQAACGGEGCNVLVQNRYGHVRTLR